MTTLGKATRDFFDVTKTKSAQEVGAAFVEYILESDHGNWDGTPTRDKASMGRMLEDFTRWLGSGDFTDPVIYTGAQYMTTDR